MKTAMSTASNAIKTGIFTLLVPLVVGVSIPQRMLSGSAASAPFVWRGIGAVLFALGVIGYFWCAALFVRAQGTPAPVFPTKRAVVKGPYRINRNPMYTSVLAVVFGQAMFYQSARVGEYGLFVALCFHLFVMFYEERDLRARFGAKYEDFCRKVPRWIPHVKRGTRR